MRVYIEKKDLLNALDLSNQTKDDKMLRAIIELVLIGMIFLATSVPSLFGHINSDPGVGFLSILLAGSIIERSFLKKRALSKFEDNLMKRGYSVHFHESSIRGVNTDVRVSKFKESKSTELSLEFVYPDGTIL